jgi:hypothetical protein
VQAAGATTEVNASGQGRSLSTLLVLVLGVVVCRLAVLSSDWGYDTGAWMYLSQRLLAGARLYVDVTDNKLPPLYWIGALYWKTGFPRAAMFVTEVALTTVSALALASILRRAGLGARVALLFGALFVCASQPAWEYAHRLESYALAPLAIALALLARATLDQEPPRLREHVLAGALISLAVSFRAQHILDALLVGVWVLTMGGRSRWRRFASYAAGGLAWAAALIAIASAQGFLGPMLRDGVLQSAGYAAGHEAKPPKLGAVIWALRVNIDLMPVTWFALGTGVALAATAWPRVATKARSLFALAALLACAQFASTFIARHQIIHYHFPLGWTAALVAGLGAAIAGLRFGVDPARARWLVPAAAIVLLTATAFPDPRVYDGVYKLVFPRSEQRTDRLEDLVREHIPADGKLYFLDDYSMAGVLTRVPNPPATPRTILAMQAVFQDPEDPPEGLSPYGLTTLAWGRAFRAEMQRDPPPWLVRKQAIEDELSPWVRANYDEIASSGGFTVWKHREGPRSP